MGGKTTTGTGRNAARAPIKTALGKAGFRESTAEDKIGAVVDALMQKLGKTSPVLRKNLIKKLQDAQAKKQDSGETPAGQQNTGVKQEGVAPALEPKSVEVPAAPKKEEPPQTPQKEMNIQSEKEDLADKQQKDAEVKDYISSAMADILGTQKPAPVEAQKPQSGLINTSPNVSFPIGDQKALMAKKLGDQKGTNEGGIYEGADGKMRYVKLYKEPTQAVGEAVAHAFYNALGIPAAPHGQVFDAGDGRVGVAADLIDNQGELAKVGLTKERAQEILQGFAADMLLANWDVVGNNEGYMRNIILGKDGKLHRIDNGGALLFSGLAGKKPTHLLEGLNEWNKFVSENPSYKEVFKAAGIKSADEMKTALIGQAKMIQALYDTSDGFKGLVPSLQLNGKDVVPAEDRNAMIAVLSKKFEHLKQKLGVTTAELQGKQTIK